jgi:hypothetical protein
VLDWLDRDRAMAASSQVTEIACHHPITLPEPVWPVLVAHRVYRLLGGGVTEADPLFVHPNEAVKPPHATLREAIIRTCQLVYHPAPWMHRDPCRHGGDIGLTPRAQGWRVQRGLSVHLLDPEVVARVPHRPAPTGHRGASQR